jgi:hypothetical protein
MMNVLSYFFFESFTGGIFFLLLGFITIIDTIYFDTPMQKSRYHYYSYHFIEGFAASFGFFALSITLMVWRISLFIDALF